MEEVLDRIRGAWDWVKEHPLWTAFMTGVVVFSGFWVFFVSVPVALYLVLGTTKLAEEGKNFRAFMLWLVIFLILSTIMAVGAGFTAGFLGVVLF